MKKKILAVCLAAAMLTGTVPAAYAAAIDDLKIAAAVLSGESGKVIVPTDIKLKKDASDYVNGPLSLFVDDASSTSFDFKADIKMDNVIAKMTAYETAAKRALKGNYTDEKIAEAINSCYVSEGEFKIKITLPSSANFVVPQEFIDGTDMYGFTSENGKHNEVFEEVSRVKTDNIITVTIKVKGGEALTLAMLKENLSDLSLECKGITVDAIGTYTVKGAVEGHTTISSPSDKMGDVRYEFVQGTEGGMAKDPQGGANDISGTIVVERRNGNGGHGLGGGTTVVNKTVTIVIADGIDNKTQTFRSGSEVLKSEINVPSRPGYKFEGFYKDAECTQALEDEFIINDDMTIYTKWTEDKTDVPNPPLVTDEHFAYVIGYPTGDDSEIVRPEANITREEIATIFYRLLTDTTRDTYFTAENDFADVSSDRWSNKAVSTMANGGYVVGYEDGTFKPAANITRAELVTIIARFCNVSADVSVKNADYTDIDGHWAKGYINYATEQGWLAGYEDGTFKPDRAITRAESMRIINNLLNRHVNAEGLHADAKTWDDNSSTAWYYYDVIEATNSHDYTREEGEIYEKWTAITENKVWTDKPIYEDAE